MDGELGTGEIREKKKRKGEEAARNEPLLLLVPEIWGLFVTAADLSLS